MPAGGYGDKTRLHLLEGFKTKLTLCSGFSNFNAHLKICIWTSCCETSKYLGWVYPICVCPQTPSS